MRRGLNLSVGARFRTCDWQLCDKRVKKHATINVPSYRGIWNTSSLKLTMFDDFLSLRQTLCNRDGRLDFFFATSVIIKSYFLPPHNAIALKPKTKPGPKPVPKISHDSSYDSIDASGPLQSCAWDTINPAQPDKIAFIKRRTCRRSLLCPSGK